MLTETYYRHRVIASAAVRALILFVGYLLVYVIGYFTGRHAERLRADVEEHRIRQTCYAEYLNGTQAAPGVKNGR